ncbi:conserved hypothetical protein [Histoplasma capsulatum var. duboisii H88]|uniref:Uncharacterized protein n=1 Tax=Ajellomyces capsulatus (strain H88) TaxID=544711 RepID=F0U5U8_AJEC8|nr:conserved hypothetical protein [Histoplasma capsulatum var. duboisii H88]
MALVQLPCERCIPKLGDVDSWCAFGPKARKRCEACASAGKTCAPVRDSPLVRRIMRGRAFIFYDVAAGEDMANHKERLRRLVKQLDAPRLARLSARGRVGANALWSRCRAAAVPARMQDMEAVVVPGLGVVVQEEEEVEEGVEQEIKEDPGILGRWSSGDRWVEQS